MAIRIVYCGVFCVAICLAATTASGQQTVQLPTLSVFTVDTTVSVPDRGGMWLGGIGRGAMGASGRGGLLPRRGGIGGSTAAGALRISATIIDHQELDRLVLAAAEDRRKRARVADPLSLKFAAATASQPARRPQSVAQIRSGQATAESPEEASGLDDWQRGQQAEAAGKTGAARIYYRLAAGKLQGERRQQAIERLNRLAPANAPRKAAP